MRTLTMVLTLGCTQEPVERPVHPAARMAEVSVVRAIVTALADPALRGRDEGSVGSAVVRRYLVDQLTACGVRPAGVAGGYLQPIGAGKGTNVLGRIAGTGPHDQYLLLGAHYDHQDSGWWTVHPGAQDNAAAVAALLHVACALAADPLEREVVVAFWDAEEPPTFLTPAMGSRWWHAHPTRPLERLGTTVVLDLLGAGMWEGFRGTFALGSETSEQVRAAVDAAAAQEEAPMHVASLSLVEDFVVGPQMVWSDYEVFRAHETPVLFLTDGQNDRYHTARDRVEALDLPKLEAEARWLRSLVSHLASGPAIRWTPTRDPAQDHAATRHLLQEALRSQHPWPPTAREALQASLDELAAVSAPSPRAVRRAAQRLMCWSGPHASPFTCGLL